MGEDVFETGLGIDVTGQSENGAGKTGEDVVGITAETQSTTHIQPSCCGNISRESYLEARGLGKNENPCTTDWEGTFLQ